MAPNHIHQMNRVNSRNDFKSWWQHYKHCPELLLLLLLFRLSSRRTSRPRVYILLLPIDHMDVLLQKHFFKTKNRLRQNRLQSLQRFSDHIVAFRFLAPRPGRQKFSSLCITLVVFKRASNVLDGPPIAIAIPSVSHTSDHAETIQNISKYG